MNLMIKTIFIIKTFISLGISEFTYILGPPNNYTAGQQYCETLGGDLATIQTISDFNKASLECSEYGCGCWIGLSRINNTSQYTWINGTNITNTIGFNINGIPIYNIFPWASQQITDTSITNCIVILTTQNTSYFQVSCSDKLAILCQVEATYSPTFSTYSPTIISDIPTSATNTPSITPTHKPSKSPIDNCYCEGLTPCKHKNDGSCFALTFGYCPPGTVRCNWIDVENNDCYCKDPNPCLNRVGDYCMPSYEVFGRPNCWPGTELCE